MAYPAFPEIMAPDMNGGIQEETYRPLRRTEFEGNAVAVRPRSVRARRRWQVKWSRLPQADYDALKAFFDSRQGSPFSWLNQSDGYQYTVVFADDSLKASTVIYDGSTSGLRRSVTLTLEEHEEQWQFASDETDAADAPAVAVTLAVVSGQSVTFTHDAGCTIDWGDGETESGTPGEEEHTYGTAGTYILSIVPADGTTQFSLSGLGFALVSIARFRLPEGVTSFRRMFAGTSLRHLPAFDLHHAAVADVQEEFDGCVLLESLGGLTNPDSVVTATAQFHNCKSLKYLNGFSNGALCAACDLQFSGCSSLEEIPDDFRNGPATVTMARQFFGCASLADVPFHNVFPQGKTPWNVTMMFYGDGALTGFVPPSRAWDSGRATSHSAIGAPFGGCSKLENYTDMPELWSGVDFTRTNSVTPVFVDNSGALDTTVNGSFAFRVEGAETDADDVPFTVTDGSAPAVTLKRGVTYRVIPGDTETYPKVLRVQFRPATVLDDRTVEVETTVYVGRALASVELLAVDGDTYALFKCRATQTATASANCMMSRRTGISSTFSFKWGDSTETTSNMGVSQSGVARSHAYAETGEYLVQLSMRGASISRCLLTGARNADAKANAAAYGECARELYYYRILADMGNAFYECRFSSLPDGFGFASSVSSISECFYNVPLREIPDGMFDGWTSGTKNVSKAFYYDRPDPGGMAIPALWGRAGVTFNNVSDCFTGRVGCEGFAEAVANGWATEPTDDPEAEAAKVRAIASEIGTAIEGLSDAWDEGEWDEDHLWSPIVSRAEALLELARQADEHASRYRRLDGNLLPIYAYQWALVDGENEIQTEFIDVISETRYSITLNAGYKMTLRYYSADDVLRDAFVYNATVGGTTYHTTASNVAKVQVMLSLLSGEDISASQLTLDAASPRMEVAP